MGYQKKKKKQQPKKKAYLVLCAQLVTLIQHRKDNPARAAAIAAYHKDDYGLLTDRNGNRNPFTSSWEDTE